MLLVAIPKSASTSLMITLGELHNIKSVQDFSFKSNEIPEDSHILHTIHSDIREITQENVDHFNQSNIFFKQHIFPSQNNLKLLNGIKKIVLIREPKEILYAYLRGAKKKHNGLPKGYLVDELTKKKILNKSKTDGFFDDICFFKEEWVDKADPEFTLIVNYNDYLKNTKGVMNRIESFFELPLTTQRIKPVKARYSKDNYLKKQLIKLIVNILDVLKIKSFIKKLIKR